MGESAQQTLANDPNGIATERGHGLVPQFRMLLAVGMFVLSLLGIWLCFFLHRGDLYDEVQRKSLVLTQILSVEIEAANAAEDWDRVVKLLYQAADLDEVELVLVANPSGVLIGAGDTSLLDRKLSEMADADLRRCVERVMGTGLADGYERGTDSGPQWVSVSPLSGGATGSELRSAVVIGISLSRFETQVGWHLVFLVLLALTGVFFTLGITSSLLSRLVQQPIDVLTRAVGDTAHGVGFRVRHDVRFEEFRRLGASLEYAFGVSRDASDEARVVRERFTSVIANLPGAFYQCYWTVSRDFTLLSPNVKDLIGYTHSELIGDGAERSFADLIHVDDRERVNGEVHRAVARRESFETVYRMCNSEGEELWVSDHGCGVVDMDGRLLHLDGVIFDITERMNHELELEKAKNELEVTNQNLSDAFDALEATAVRANDLAAVAHDASRAKSDFLANMSHEIRTPMTAILGYAEMLIANDQTEEDRQIGAEVIKRNGEHLLALINDILDVSKIDADKMSVEQIECSPWAIACEVRDTMSGPARKKGLELELVGDGRLPKMILSDPTRIRQILTNLIGNSIKFTEAGRVTLKVSIRGKPADDDCKLCYEVIDTGIGLEPGQIKGLFNAFTQADTSTTRRFGGTGLGLHIAQRLARLMGGNIEVESTVDEGSCFRVTIDPHINEHSVFVTAPEDQLLQKKSVGHSVPVIDKLNARILLAEDGADNQRLISFLLRKAGATVDIAVNGVEALDMALKAEEAGTSFNVILMDMQMPELDGYGATRKLRESGYAGPIIALTAHAMTGDRDRCINAGCDDYTTKPIKRQELFEKISRLSVSPKP